MGLFESWGPVKMSSGDFGEGNKISELCQHCPIISGMHCLNLSDIICVKFPCSAIDNNDTSKLTQRPVLLHFPDLQRCFHEWSNHSQPQRLPTPYPNCQCTGRARLAHPPLLTLLWLILSQGISQTKTQVMALAPTPMNLKEMMTWGPERPTKWAQTLPIHQYTQVANIMFSGNMYWINQEGKHRKKRNWWYHYCETRRWSQKHSTGVCWICKSAILFFFHKVAIG